MNFVMGLPAFLDETSKTYNSILVILYWLIKIVNYKLIKFTIDTPEIAEIVLYVIIRHHSLPN